MGPWRALHAPQCCGRRAGGAGEGDARPHQCPLSVHVPPRLPCNPKLVAPDHIRRRMGLHAPHRTNDAGAGPMPPLFVFTPGLHCPLAPSWPAKRICTEPHDPQSVCVSPPPPWPPLPLWQLESPLPHYPPRPHEMAPIVHTVAIVPKAESTSQEVSPTKTNSKCGKGHCFFFFEIPAYRGAGFGEGETPDGKVWPNKTVPNHITVF